MRTPRPKADGFSLMESMVASAIGLLVLAALFAELAGSSMATKLRERDDSVQSSGWYAFNLIKADLLHAGYVGLGSRFLPDRPLSSLGINVANACDGDIGRLSQRIRGWNDSNPYAATCIPPANYAGSDVLVIRGLNPAPVNAPFDPAVIYYRSAFEGGQAFPGNKAPDFTGSAKAPPYMDFQVSETVYYVSPWTVSASEKPQVPALFRLRLSAGPAMRPELVASGVDTLQVRFAVQRTDDTVRYVKADQLTGPADWEQVNGVQIRFLLQPADRGNESAAAGVPVSGDQSAAIRNSNRRVEFGSVVQLRN